MQKNAAQRPNTAKEKVTEKPGGTTEAAKTKDAKKVHERQGSLKGPSKEDLVKWCPHHFGPVFDLIFFLLNAAVRCKKGCGGKVSSDIINSSGGHSVVCGLDG